MGEQDVTKAAAHKTIKRLKEAEHAAFLAQKSSPFAEHWTELSEALSLIVRARLDLERKYADPQPLINVIH